MGRRARRHREGLVAAAAHGVSNLRVFGTVVRGEDRPDSDVDLLADFPPGLSLFGLDDLLVTQLSIPWRQTARMRDYLAHRYFDTASRPA